MTLRDAFFVAIKRASGEGRNGCVGFGCGAFGAPMIKMKTRAFRLSATWLAGLFAAALLLACSIEAREAKPKFGPYAIPVGSATEYLRKNPAPDYWAISPFYIAQETDSDCSIASATIVLNVLRGIPALSADELVTPRALITAVNNQQWIAQTRQGGEGVTLVEMHAYLEQSLRAYRAEDYEIAVFRPNAASPDNLELVRKLLMQNEQSERDIVLVYFNQSVLTGDWDGPHISPVGAYDSATDRVLIMDVDRRWYVPYWSSLTRLFESMLRPTPERFGHLRGGTGGILHIKPKQP